MGAPTVLIAFASQSGSTAAIADVIAGELRAAGFEVDCRPASDVSTLGPYTALVLGSGVFVRSRGADGGGFLTRHAATLATLPVWLFSAGPIGGGHDVEPGAMPDRPVVDVARAIGARGAATFGALDATADADMLARPVELPCVRAWAHEIAAALGRAPLAVAS